MIRGEAARVGTIVAAVAIAIGLRYRAGVLLALLAIATAGLAVLQLSLVVSRDIVCSSAGLN